MLRRVHGIRGLALSVALGMSLLLAACNGPTVVEGTGKAGPYDVTLKIDPPTMQAGQKATLNYFFTDPAGGNKPVTNLATDLGTPLQVFAVDTALGYFQHDRSPGVTLGPGGAPLVNAYPVNILFGREGTYTVFAEFAPTVVVTDATTGKKTNKAGNTVVYSSTISFGTSGRPEDEPARLSEDTRTKTVGGVTIAMTPTTELHAHQPATLVFTLSELGTPINTLATYLGAAGHLVAIDQNKDHFAHVLAQEGRGQVGASGSPVGEPSLGMGVGATGGNPSGQTSPGAAATATFPPVNTPTTGPGPGVYVPPPTVPPSTSLGGGTFGPTITFQPTFDAPGLYRLWAQFLYRGYVLTADYVVNVQP